jgi:hypothetical protein
MFRRNMHGAGLLGGVAALLLAGCSGGLTGTGPGPIPYQPSNAIAPTGYSESLIGPDHYRIVVTGPANTPRQRMEKIAATRAAEIGKDNRLGYFKIDNPQFTTRCQKYTEGGQRGGSGSQARTLHHAIYTADVMYTKTPPDQSYVQAKPAFEQYRSELDADQTPPLPLDPALAAQCS